MQYSNKWYNQNFKQLAKNDPEKHKEQSAKGGRISGERKRQKAERLKIMQETAESTLMYEYLLEEEYEMYKKFKRRQKYLEKKKNRGKN